MRGFKFPANNIEYDENSNVDVENVQQFQFYCVIHLITKSISDIIKTGTTKTHKIYIPILDELREDYGKVCKLTLSLASLCVGSLYIYIKKKNKDYECKLTSEKAFNEIEPAIKSILLVVQTKMDLTFPLEIVQRIGRLEIEKEILELEEATGGIKKFIKKINDSFACKASFF